MFSSKSDGPLIDASHRARTNGHRILAFFKYRVGTLFRACEEKLLTKPRCLLRVSKQWKDLLKAMPGLWRELDLSNARKAVRVSAVKNYAKYSNKLLNRAILYRADTANGEALEFLIGHCPKLEHLELLDGISNSFLVRAAPFARYLTTLVLGEAREISLDAVTEILGGCEGLIRAEFHSVVANVEAVWKHDLKSLRKLRLNGSQKPRLKDLSLLALVRALLRVPILWLT